MAGRLSALLKKNKIFNENVQDLTEEDERLNFMRENCTMIKKLKAERKSN